MARARVRVGVRRRPLDRLEADAHAVLALELLEEHLVRVGVRVRVMVRVRVRVMVRTRVRADLLGEAELREEARVVVVELHLG